MVLKKVSVQVQTTYLTCLQQDGEQKLYQRIVGQGIISLLNNSEIDYLMLDYSEAFFALYRQTGEIGYFTIGKVLRRAAHVLYRQIIKQDLARKPSIRFLNVVQ